ncbi:MAG: CDP-diacylglycerol--glycerol-3-phosphate 3-phosphatidyltransferase [Candidatus Omnitrophica bacterium]|nr:CDP-diacylglycerol--glycerol-3-phosphate 3-phosphatidyltransferase [Candidatus Omnitrophota bacterium]
MNLPNILTIARIFLTIFFIGVIQQEGFAAKVVGAALFAVASLTDFFDGYLAKTRNLITDFGKIMDPIADKFLMLSAFYIFMKLDVIAVWMFVVIAVREIGITAWRLLAMRSGKVFAAESLGKYKTVSQIAAIGVILMFMIVVETQNGHNLNETTLRVWNQCIYGLMLAAVGLTLVSGVFYIWKNRGHLNG